MNIRFKHFAVSDAGAPGGNAFFPRIRLSLSKSILDVLPRGKFDRGENMVPGAGTTP